MFKIRCVQGDYWQDDPGVDLIFTTHQDVANAIVEFLTDCDEDGMDYTWGDIEVVNIIKGDTL